MPCRCVWYGGYTLPITPIPVEMTPRRVWLCPQDGATALHLAAGLGVPAGTLEKILAVSGSAASLIDNVCGGFMQRAWVWCTAAVCTLTWGFAHRMSDCRYTMPSRVRKYHWTASRCCSRRLPMVPRHLSLYVALQVARAGAIEVND